MERGSTSLRKAHSLADGKDTFTGCLRLRSLVGSAGIGASVRGFFALHRDSDAGEAGGPEGRGRGAGDSTKQRIFYLEAE